MTENDMRLVKSDCKLNPSQTGRSARGAEHIAADIEVYVTGGRLPEQSADYFVRFGLHFCTQRTKMAVAGALADQRRPRYCQSIFQGRSLSDNNRANPSSLREQPACEQ
jgi:hypothetical protein